MAFWKDLTYGLAGERLVADFLRSEGTWHLGLHQFAMAPVTPILTGPPQLGSLSCPDFVCWSEQRGQYFIECKRRDDWVRYGGAEMLGLPLADHEGSLRVAAVTGRPVYDLFINDAAGIFESDVASLDHVKTTYVSDNVTYANFERKHLTLVLPASKFTWGWNVDLDLDAAYGEQIKALIDVAGGQFNAVLQLAKYVFGLQKKKQ
jgi:hypothetical protein